MAIRIPMSAELLGRTRFAVSPAPEILSALAWQVRPRPPRHVTRWLERAADGVDPALLTLLTDLAGSSRAYAPDFLTPAPAGRSVGIDELVDAIAATDADTVDYHLDIGFNGRPVRPDVVVQFASEEAYVQWRRPLPASVSHLLRQGHGVLAEAAAEAMRAWFDVALATDWPDVRAVLDDDIAYRGDRMVREGSTALLDDLDPSMAWDGNGVVLDRPFDGDIDWEHDGLLLLPCSSQRGVIFSAEDPDPPRVTYPARGTASLSGPPTVSAPPELRELIGETRAVLLSLLAEPGPTSRLARASGWSQATVSYHLGILARSGLVEGRRRGRSVVYSRTQRGDQLVGS
ncbi:helix-turn-helix transcriptional regulator [Janibacter sp. HTCC2649]|uniref:ArsR/SmtB family transcription factor n=1 Tax=Janibacter sp. HTCC2649 TaxID=313589 RepID=UPI0013054683|nr:winged helix-turn-helix domain-containing protein [Janibacter sp. HTCC2649]